MKYKSTTKNGSSKQLNGYCLGGLGGAGTGGGKGEPKADNGADGGDDDAAMGA